jgi:hypothetical protein
VLAEFATQPAAVADAASGDKIVPILNVGFGSTVFPLYKAAQLSGIALGRRPSLPSSKFRS